jgi:hypothetical protein
MSLGSWDPNIEAQQKTLAIEESTLQRFIAASRDDALGDMASVLSPEEQSLYAALMKLPASDWEDAAKNLDDVDSYHLMRFFTIAEGAYAGWEANEHSPVIHLNKVLKRHHSPLSKEQVLWIKSNTRNRFLPNGPIM